MMILFMIQSHYIIKEDIMVNEYMRIYWHKYYQNLKVFLRTYWIERFFWRFSQPKSERITVILYPHSCNLAGRACGDQNWCPFVFAFPRFSALPRRASYMQPSCIRNPTQARAREHAREHSCTRTDTEEINTPGAWR